MRPDGMAKNLRDCVKLRREMTGRLVRRRPPRGERALLVLLLLLPLGFVRAQSSSSVPELQRAEANLEQASAALRAAEEEAQAAQEKVERLRALYARGLIARRDLEWAELEARTAQARVEAAREVERLARDALARAREYAERAAERERRRPSLWRAPVRVARSYGAGRFTLDALGALMRAYQKRFGTPLPISAFGQTPTHDRLGLDHRGRVDIALHPESEQGRWVLDYLTRRGIPYIAFSDEVPNSATGAHIHVGLPSARK